jgi:hypothetical protein
MYFHDDYGLTKDSKAAGSSNHHLKPLILLAKMNLSSSFFPFGDLNLKQTFYYFSHTSSPFFFGYVSRKLFSWSGFESQSS